MSTSDRVKSLGLSGIREIFEKAQKIPDVIRLEFGEPDFDTPENIKQAAIWAIEKGYTKYSSSSGIPELRRAVSSKLSRENKVGYNESEIIITTGATSAIYSSLVAILNEGDEILVPDPGWATYAPAVKLSGAVPIFYPLREERGYSVDPGDIERLCSPKTRAILINSPANPTGSLLSSQDLENIAEIVKRRNLFVISDEVYEKFIYDGASSQSIASLDWMKERTITVNSFSKTYAMTGWRIGYAAADKPIAEAISKVNAASNSCISTISQYAALEALLGPQDSVSKMIEEFRRRRDLIVRALNQIAGFSCPLPKGAFYAFANTGAKGMSSLDLAMKILDGAHVAVVPGSAFGQHGEGHIRLAYANSKENIEKAIERIQTLFSKEI